MAKIRVTCRQCAAAVLLWPAQVLLLPSANHACDGYLFLCPGCGRVTVTSAGPAEVLVLLAAGVPDSGRGAPPP